MKTVTLTPQTKVLTSDAKALLEVSMMNGQIVPLSNDSLEQVLKYCLPAITQTEDLNTYISNVLDTVLRKYNHSGKDREVIAVCFNCIEDMVCVTFIINDEEQPVTYQDLNDGAYAFCYVLNTSSDWCSEFGTCTFQNFKRVG